MDSMLDVKRSRVGTRYQVDILPEQGSNGSAEERPDELVLLATSLPSDVLSSYLRQVGEHWASSSAPPAVKSPKHRSSSGKFRSRKANSLDGMAMEMALSLLHRHQYDSAAALAEGGQ